MKKYVEGVALLGAVVLWAGCQQSSAPDRSAVSSAPALVAQPSSRAATGAAALTVVKLKVPNMT